MRKAEKAEVNLEGLENLKITHDGFSANYTGEEWYQFYCGKYGAENVEWISKKPTGEEWRNYFIEEYGIDNVTWSAEELLTGV